MNIVLWIIQILLAFVFFMAGIMKLTQPKEKLVERGMTFMEDFSAATIRAIGLSEVLGALGVLLPAITGILPWLTPLAAFGLTLTMIGAILTHLRRGESSRIIVNIVLLALALGIVYGRFIALPLG